jgi:hypothetical protein
VIGLDTPTKALAKERRVSSTMPKKKETIETPDALPQPEPSESAKPEPAKSQKVPKLSKKNKNKLLRREKKALQKSSK